MPELERLAIEGGPNGDRAAMRRLVRMDTPESRAALARIRASVSGQKLATLDLWERGRGGLCLPTKSPASVAAAVHLLERDPDLRGAVVAAGNRRMADFDPAAGAAAWRDALGSR